MNQYPQPEEVSLAAKVEFSAFRSLHPPTTAEAILADASLVEAQRCYIATGNTYGLLLEPAFPDDDPDATENFNSYSDLLFSASGPRLEGGKSFLDHVYTLTFTATGAVEGRLSALDDLDQVSDSGGMHQLSMTAYGERTFLELLAKDQRCDVEDLVQRLPYVDYGEIAKKSFQRFVTALGAPEATLSKEYPHAQARQHQYFEELKSLFPSAMHLYSAILMSGSIKAASAAARQVVELQKELKPQIPDKTRIRRALGLKPLQDGPLSVNDLFSPRELRQVVAERMLESLGQAFKLLSQDRATLKALRATHLGYHKLLTDDLLPLLERAGDCPNPVGRQRVHLPTLPNLPDLELTASISGDAAPDAESSENTPPKEIPEIADITPERVAWKILPVVRDGERQALDKATQEIFETAKHRSKRPEGLRIDRRRIQALALTRHAWAAMMGAENVDDVSYYARGDWGSAPVAIEDGFEQPGDYIMLVLKQRDPQTGEEVEHVVADTPLASTDKDGGSAMYLIRADAVAGTWQEIMEQENRQFARDVGARPIKHTVPQGHELAETMALKALHLLTMPVEAYEAGRLNNFARNARMKLGSILDGLVKLEVPEM